MATTPTTQTRDYAFYAHPTTPYAARPARASMVTVGGWCYSVSRYRCPTRRVVVWQANAHRPVALGTPRARHALDGTVYSTYEGARQAAYEAGILQYMAPRHP